MISALEKLEFSKLNKRLAHLSQDEIVELTKRYLNGESVSKLIKEYKIKITTSLFYTILPPVKSDEKCEQCDSLIVYPWAPKSYANRLNLNQKYCIECNHNGKSNCKCSKCTELRIAKDAERRKNKQEEDERKRNILKDWYTSRLEYMCHEEDLTMEDRLYLAVILRAGLSEDMKSIELNNKNALRISPTYEYTHEILSTLISRNVLIVDTFNADLSAFEIKDDNQIMCDLLRVKYDLIVIPKDFEEDTTGLQMIKRLMYPDPDLFTKEFCYDMWKRVAFEESKQYLLYQMGRVGYTFKPGEKTNKVLEHLVENYSVSQIYNMIYGAISRSTARYQAGEITKPHAQNSVITSIERQGELANAEGWNLRGYGRIKDLPESIISEVLFTSIMKISYLGFSEKPTLNF